MMVPAALTDDTLHELAELVEKGDVLIDGGNSYYRDDIDRAEKLEADGIHYVDVGTSGGVFGLERGYCLMIGGTEEAVELLDPIFRTLAPGVGTAERTPGREGEPDDRRAGLPALRAGRRRPLREDGPQRHRVRADGRLRRGPERPAPRQHRQAHAGADAETAPVRDAERYYPYDFDMPAIAEVWRRGSVVASWLLDLTAAALAESPDLEEFSGRVSDSGEGRWTVAAAIDEGVPANVLSASLFSRFSSRGEADYGDKLLSAMRKQFGGHAEKPSAGV